MEEAGVIVDLDDRPTERPMISARTPIITSRITARMMYFCPEHRKTRCLHCLNACAVYISLS